MGKKKKYKSKEKKIRIRGDVEISGEDLGKNLIFEKARPDYFV